MPELLNTDPKKGFVALPASVFDLDLTPGAFRTLAELCRMANLEGQCWPSLGQLGVQLGRSRAAVSGYIAELREIGLIETETQKMANGYNYRLRYCVVFWKAWRKQLSQSAERSVKPAERPLRTKNHNHINQSPAKADFDDLISSWKASAGQTPYPAFAAWPSETLLEKTQSAIANQPDFISVDIVQEFTAFLARKGISAGTIEPELYELLRHALPYKHQAEPFLKALDALWKPHWVNPPSTLQLRRMLKALPSLNGPEAQKKLLASYLRRWDIYASTLSSSRSATKVAA